MSDISHIVCPNCDAVNRIPNARIGDDPKCGQCHKLLFSGQPTQLSSANFQAHVSRSDLPLLVDFWAPWCEPCKMMAPQFVQATNQLEPNVRVAKVNTEAEQNLAALYNIRSIPTLVLFNRGQEAARQAGAMGAVDIVRWVRSHMT